MLTETAMNKNEFKNPFWWMERREGEKSVRKLREKSGQFITPTGLIEVKDNGEGGGGKERDENNYKQ